MRRRASVRNKGEMLISDELYGTSWLCECEYSNVGTQRCYFCGSRAPREFREPAATALTPEPEPRTEPEAEATTH